MGFWTNSRGLNNNSKKSEKGMCKKYNLDFGEQSDTLSGFFFLKLSGESLHLREYKV